MTTPIAIDSKRLLQRLDDFARIGATPAGGVNRQALSPEDRASRRLLAELALARGFRAFQDPMANLFIRREGRFPEMPPFVIGSHLDSQPTGGRFDGALGTLTAFEVLESIEDAGIETDLPIEVVAWTNEEGSRFAPGTMGSMAFAAGAIPDAWSGLRGRDGALFVDELKATLDALPEAAMRPLGLQISGYIELHRAGTDPRTGKHADRHCPWYPGDPVAGGDDHGPGGACRHDGARVPSRPHESGHRRARTALQQRDAERSPRALHRRPVCGRAGFGEHRVR